MATEPSTPPPATPSRAERLSGVFHHFWAAGTLTNLGDGLLATALPLIAATLTHDPLAVSGLVAVRFLPWLLIAPFSGVLLDRTDRLRAMAVANVVAAGAVGLLAITVLTGHASLGILYATLFTVICCETVTDPASRVSVVRLVPTRLLDRANSRLEGGRLVAQEFAARPIAGILFTVAAVLPVAGAALSYALCAVLTVTVVVLLRRSSVSVEDGAGADAEDRQGVLLSLREGLGYVFGRSLPRRLMLNNAGIMIGVQMGVAVLVLHVQDDLGVPPALFGLFMASTAVGGILGSVSVARLVHGIGRRAVMMAGYVGMGLSLALVGLVSNAYLAFLAWVVLGVAMALSNVAASPYFQTAVPNHLRGRVSAAFRMVGWGLAPIGALLGGLLGRVDLDLPYLAGGLLVVGVAVVFRGAIAECARLCDEAASAADDR